MAAEGRRYHVQHVLGRGGFGTVYQAEMISGGGFAKPVALKVLNQEMGGMAEVAQRLRDEARLLGRLKHPAILRVDDLVQLEGAWTVVMELLAGANLHQLVRASGPLPLGVALEVAHVVAGALHAAHDRPGPGGEPLRVLHRDIKPSNIQLTPLGEVKVLDFGVARASFATREAATRSLIFGSVGYMAPERMAGRDSHAGDVYALGVVVYEILAGKRLGTACSRPSLQAALVEEALGALAELQDDEELHDLLRAALAFEPEARPRAEQFQRRARRLRARFPDPWMSDWADSVLPAVMQLQERGSGPLSGRVLRENAPADTEVDPTEEVSMPSSRPRPATGFTPPTFEPSEPHTPTAGHKARLDDDIPSEPLGLPPLPAPRGRTPLPTPAPTLPRPAVEQTAEPEATPEASEDPTRFEPVQPGEPEQRVPAPLVEVRTAMETPPKRGSAPAPEEPAPEPAPPDEPPPPPAGRSKLPWVAPLLALGILAVGLAVLLGPVRSALKAPGDAGLEGDLAPEAAEPAAAEPVPESEPEPEPVDAPSVEPTPEPVHRQPAPPPPEPEPDLAPAPSAEPHQPDRAAVPEPVEDAPSPTGPEAPTQATVVVMGDASSVALTNGDASHGPGTVPPGSYVIMALFPGLDAPIQAGELQLTAGETVTISCQSGFDRCDVSERVNGSWGG